MKKTTFFLTLLCLLCSIQHIFGQHTRLHLTGGGSTTTGITSISGFTSTGTPTVDYAPGSISYTTGSSTLPNAGGKIKILGNTIAGAGASFANYALPASYTSGSVFVSFMFKMNTNTFSGDIRNFQFYLGNNYTATSGERTAMFHTRGRPLTGDFVQFAATKSGANTNLSTAIFNGNANTLNAANTNGQTFNSVPSSATYFVVMRYEFKTGGTNNDEVTMWVFSNNQGLPSPASIPTSGAIVAGDNATILDVAAINQIGFTYGYPNGAGAGPYSDVEFDAINVGTSWAEVIPHVRQTPATITDFGSVSLGSIANNPQTINVRGNALTPGSTVALSTTNNNFLMSTTTSSGSYTNSGSLSEADIMSSTGKNIFVDFMPTTGSGTQTGLIQTQILGLPAVTSGVSGTISAAATPQIRVQNANQIVTHNQTININAFRAVPRRISLDIFNTGASGTTLTGTMAVSGTGFTLVNNPNTLSQVGANTPTVVNIDFLANTAGTSTGSVTFTSNSSNNPTFTVNFSVTVVNPNLNLFVGVNTPVTSFTFTNQVFESFNISEQNLSGHNFSHILVTSSPNFEILPGSGIYSNTILVPVANLFASSGMQVQIQVRFMPLPTTPAGNVTGSITFQAHDGTNVIPGSTFVSSPNYPNTIPLSGTVVVPTLTANPITLPAFAQTTGGQVSAVQTYTLTGTNVTANITVTAPTNFQVAKGTGTSITFASTASVTAAEANAGQVISVRFAPTLLIPTGNASGNITHSGFANTNVAVSASAVTELESWSNNFQILGNPTREFVRVKCDNPSQWDNAEVNFTRIDGKQNFASKWNDASQTLQINVSKWEKGLYILKIAQGKKVATKKIVVE